MFRSQTALAPLIWTSRDSLWTGTRGLSPGGAPGALMGALYVRADNETSSRHLFL